ncbi:MAG: preprotein translocase subunit SecA [Candidatus Liptonbacteria bacterium]|nr:preprotein translocase subunit SecA [Candidatus Liptonbacteria bacterium]
MASIFLFLKRLISPGVDFSSETAQINALEETMRTEPDEQLRSRSRALRDAVQSGKPLDECLPEAFALVREAARRTLGQRHFDVQLMGGIALHRGAIAEMGTGEGKTLAATAPVYLNALAGGVHIVTVNEYLAKRDAVWMGQIYDFLGLKVACLIHDGALLYDSAYRVAPDAQALMDKERDTTGSFLVQEEFLRPITRREAYQADVTYGTNHEFGFDYLRDNLVQALEHQVQGKLNYAIIDEVDSILIDEARTPLIISAPDVQSSEYYKTFARVARNLLKDEDYQVDEKLRTVSILETGIEKVEKMIGIRDLYGPENLRLVHYLEESLRAQALFRRDKDYVVKNGEIIIVDEFTGRLMVGRRYSGGLHQAIEAKEGVIVREESRTYAKISIQNYFRLYKKLGGMTGTAQTSAEEFHTVYNLDVVTIPPNRPNMRADASDIVYKTADMKYRKVAEEVKRCHDEGRPVLVGTSSITKNEIVSQYLQQIGVPHEVLNAKQNDREGAIIAQAGRLKAVTVATNMAGRGVDIILGGNPPDAKEAKNVRDLGGLYVLGTERHDARRIDNQLRGRAGRQGDPGMSKFFLSLEDDLMRIFGGERVKGMMDTLNIPDDMPIESGLVARVIRQAQEKVEGFNFDARKHLLEYDDVLNKQRIAIYKKRQEIISAIAKEDAERILAAIFHGAFKRNLSMLLAGNGNEENWKAFSHALAEAKIIGDTGAFDEVMSQYGRNSEEVLREKINDVVLPGIRQGVERAISDPTIRAKIIAALDMLWMGHLEDIEALTESVRIRAYGQHDPLVEYRRESRRLYQGLLANFEDWLFFNLLRIVSTESTAASSAASVASTPLPAGTKKVGRNDPCPCGATHPDGRPKKYKHCHGQ